MASKEPSVSVSVLIDDSALPRIRAVARRLAQAGLAIHEVQEGTGTITGTIATAKLMSLRKLEGVAAVEEARQVAIPAPDSEIQ
jgi:hypothetical protein